MEGNLHSAADAAASVQHRSITTFFHAATKFKLPCSLKWYTRVVAAAKKGDRHKSVGEPSLETTMYFTTYAHLHSMHSAIINPSLLLHSLWASVIVHKCWEPFQNTYLMNTSLNCSQSGKSSASPVLDQQDLLVLM